MTTSDCGSRSVYLVTYSQVDKEKCETKDEFAQMVCNEFLDCRVTQWVCCEEDHLETSGTHYHLALKLDRVKRWKSVRQKLQDKYNFCVNFSDHHSNYYTAYRYVTKGENFVTSENHQEYISSPLTSKASRSRKRKQPADEGEYSGGGYNRSSKIDMCSLYETVVKKNIKSDLELCGLAKTELDDGKRDFANFVLRKSEKTRNDIIKTAWKIYSSADVIARRNRNRLDILQEAAEGECECDDEWKNCALEILENNETDSGEFATAIHTALEKGRGQETKCYNCWSRKLRQNLFIETPNQNVQNFC